MTSCRLLLLAVCAVASSAPVPAGASWTGVGFGAGSGSTATMPAGSQPSASVSSQSVTVSWAQSSFLGSLLGSYGGGGYTIARHPEGASGATATASCDTTSSGAGATLQCVETDVPYGAWQYTVTPVLHSFSGLQGARSATVHVATAAPVLITLTASNPSAGQSTGDILLDWGAVSGATGYDVYRRVADGSYDFSSPLNGVIPISAGTAYTDAGLGLSPATAYHYVVRAVAGSPSVASESSNEQSATAFSRPAAPSGAVTATAAAAARVDIGWAGVSGAAGYNVYRRTTAGSYDFASPVNGAMPVTALAHADLGAVDATTYVYVVRSLVIGSGGAQVESTSSAESSPVTADGVAPPTPTAVSVSSGGNVTGSALCGIAAGTRYINNAGTAAVGVSATIAIPEPGETVIFSATTPGSTPVTATVGAAGATVSGTLNLTTLSDGVLTLTARTSDLAGNMSATKAPSNVIVKDIVAAGLSGVSYTDRSLSADRIVGTSECGATIVAIQTAPGSATYTSAPVGAAGTFSLTVAALALTAYSYNVSATDVAGNTSATTVVAGNAVL